MLFRSETKFAQPELAAGTHNLELEPKFVSQDSPEPAAGTQDSDSDTYLEWMKRSSIHHLQGKRKL